MMNRKEIKEWVVDYYEEENFGNSWRKIKFNPDGILDSLINETNYLDKNCKITERLYHIYYDLYEKPKCKICDNEVNFYGFNKEYATHCSRVCVSNDSELAERIKNSNKNTYKNNYDNIRNKMDETNMKKYGSREPNKLNEIKNKRKETFMNKYGVTHSSYSESVKEKRKQTSRKNFGVDYPFQSEEFKQKRQETFQKRQKKN